MTPEELVGLIKKSERSKALVPKEHRTRATKLFRKSDPPLYFQPMERGAMVVAEWPGSEVKTSITLQLDQEMGFRVVRSCTCADHRACLHPAAVITKLYSYDPAKFGLELELRRQDDFLDKARKAVTQSLLSTPANIAVDDGQLSLILWAADEPHPKLRMIPKFLRAGRNGAITPNNAVSLELGHHGVTPVPAGGWPQGFESALETLFSGKLLEPAPPPKVTQSYYGRKEEPVPKPAGLSAYSPRQIEAAMQLIQACPLYWQSAAQSLQWLGLQTVDFEWIHLDQGDQRLQVQIDGQPIDPHDLDDYKAISLFNKGLLLNLRKQTLSLTAHPPKRLHAALEAPLTSAALADELRMKLAEMGVNLGLPLPHPVVKVEEVRVQPKAFIRFTNVDRNYVRGVFEVSYNDRLMPLRSPDFIEVVEIGKRLWIFRDWEAEKRLRAAVCAKLHATLSQIDTSLWISIPTYTSSPGRSPTLPRILSVLDAMGIGYRLPDGFNYEVLKEPEVLTGSVIAQSDGKWLEVGLGFELENGKRIELLPYLRDWLQTKELTVRAAEDEAVGSRLWIQVDKGTFVPLLASRLREAMSPILDWLRGGMVNKEGKMKIRAMTFGSIEAIAETGHAQFTANKEAQDIINRFRNRRAHCPQPVAFQGELYGYQKEGLNWLSALADCGMGGLLADDMGLGKTIQVLAHIQSERERNAITAPVLVVCPPSLLSQWKNEAAKFAPELKLLKVHGAARYSLHPLIPQNDLILTTYQTLRKDQFLFGKHRFAILVLDETRNIKSAKTLVAHAVRVVKTSRRIALGGTPIENNLTEFWSCLDAVEPGILGSLREFTDYFIRPIAQGDEEARRRLISRTAPLMLRRRKSEVASDLPPKTETIVHCEMGQKQRDMYETLRVMVHAEIMGLLAERGLARSRMLVIEKMLRLRQCCDNPRLVDGTSAIASCKQQWIADNLPTMLADGQRVLIFSEWTSMLALIEAQLEDMGIGYALITGDVSVPGRGKALLSFKSGEVSVFLISMKAGGVGLDIPEADTVITVEPQWNPQTEKQAEDRAHRLGQKNPVMVYRLIVPGTLEEKIVELQQHKLDLADSIMGNAHVASSQISEEDIHALLGAMAQQPDAEEEDEAEDRRVMQANEVVSHDYMKELLG